MPTAWAAWPGSVIQWLKTRGWVHVITLHKVNLQISMVEYFRDIP